MPTNRKFHVAVVYRDNMFVHGGVIEFEGITNELWKFSHGTMTSVQHTSVVASAHCLYIRGIDVAEIG